MIVADTSAIVAILLAEPQAEALADRLSQEVVGEDFAATDIAPALPS